MVHKESLICCSFTETEDGSCLCYAILNNLTQSTVSTGSTVCFALAVCTLLVFDMGTGHRNLYAVRHALKSSNLWLE